MVDLELSHCDLRAGRDVADLVGALRAAGAACAAEALDLRHNTRLDDAALQPLLLALSDKVSFGSHQPVHPHVRNQSSANPAL